MFHYHVFLNLKCTYIIRLSSYEVRIPKTLIISKPYQLLDKIFNLSTVWM